MKNFFTLKGTIINVVNFFTLKGTIINVVNL